MPDKSEIENLSELIWAFKKFLASDLADRLQMQVNKAMSEVHDMYKNQVSSKEFDALEPMLEDYKSLRKEKHPMASIRMKMIIKKINELY
jgi:hypothetical protein